MLLDQLFSGKIRVKLLIKLLLNPTGKVYLRGLERELGVSSNTVRLELNKLSGMQLIEVSEGGEVTNKKHYTINTAHPLFLSLRTLILKYIGIDQILEHVIRKLGNIEKVYLAGDIAEGKDSMIIDLVIVGNIDKVYLYQLIEKAESIIDKKIRVCLFSPDEFSNKYLEELGTVIDLVNVS